jgi:hypothetical protein
MGGVARGGSFGLLIISVAFAVTTPAAMPATVGFSWGHSSSGG